MAKLGAQQYMVTRYIHHRTNWYENVGIGDVQNYSWKRSVQACVNSDRAIGPIYSGRDYCTAVWIFASMNGNWLQRRNKRGMSHAVWWGPKGLLSDWCPSNGRVIPGNPQNGRSRMVATCVQNILSFTVLTIVPVKTDLTCRESCFVCKQQSHGLKTSLIKSNKIHRIVVKSGVFVCIWQSMSVGLSAIIWCHFDSPSVRTIQSYYVIQFWGIVIQDDKQRFCGC